MPFVKQGTEMKFCFEKMFGFSLVFLATLLLLSACSSGGGADDSQSDADGDSSEKSAECVEDYDCGAGMFCSAYGTCIKSCRREDDCRDSVCDTDYSSPTFGYCVECTGDINCAALAANAWCDMVDHRCRIGCDNCRDNEICVEDRCIALEDPDGDDDTEETVDGDIEQKEPFYCPYPEDDANCLAECSECVNDTTIRTCREDGSGWDSRICDDGQFCDIYTGKCSDLVCVPFSKECADITTVRECDDNGYLYTDVSCEGFQICVDGECVISSCEAGPNTYFWAMNIHSEISAADRWCQKALPIGSATWEAESGHGGVMSFAGSGEHTLLPSNVAYYQEAATLLVSFKASSLEHNMSLIAKGDPVSYELAIEEGQVVWRVNVEGNMKTLKGDAIEADTWYTIAGTFSGNDMKLYLDGEIQAAPLEFSSSKLIQINNRPVTIGGRTIASGAVANPFEGLMDNLFMDARSLTETEIDYFAATTAPCPVEEGHEYELICDNLCKRSMFEMRIIYDWEDSGINVEKGETLVINPGGCADPGATVSCLPPDGLPETCAECPLPDDNHYSVIARIEEDGEAFYAGERTLKTMSANGSLWLGYNDDDFNGHDSLGGFVVLVEQGYCPIECPEDMVQVPGKNVCVDRYEASCPDANHVNSPCDSTTMQTPLSRPGVIPWTNILSISARDACDRAGKRLCTNEEWEVSCGGDELTLYSYGNSYHSAYCNDASYTTPNSEQEFIPTGTMPKCVNGFGAYDMCGNVSELAGEAGPDGTTAYGGRRSGTTSTCRDSFEIDDESARVGFRCCIDKQANVINF